MVFGGLVEQEESAGLTEACSVENYSELLARDLTFLGGNDLLLSICCLNAYHNGATTTIMSGVLNMNSARIDTLLQQFERWQKYERPLRRRTDIVEELADLRNDIKCLGEP